jgi:hypothetical protein
MSTKPSYRAVTVAQPSSTAARLQPFQELLADCATIRIQKADVTSFKYLVHLVLIKSEVDVLPVGHAGWMPMGHRAVGAIALRLDHPRQQILGYSIKGLNHKQWMGLCFHLGVFNRALDQLALRSPVRALAQWDSDPHCYFRRNVWLRAHWQWLRIREENPGLATLTISLSEAVAVAEAKDVAATAARFAAATTRARQKPGLN